MSTTQKKSLPRAVQGAEQAVPPKGPTRGKDLLVITVQHLTADQVAQLDALLADTTPGGGVYRPPVAQNIEILGALAHAGLVMYTADCGYEITDAGCGIVVDRARYAADTEDFLRYADEAHLRKAIRKLKVVFNDLTDVEERQQTLVDIEACQDALDELADGQSESTGRHREVPADDRPTQVLPTTGTPGLPVVESVLGPDPDEEATVRLIAAIRATPTDDEMAALADINTASWAALAADLAAEPGRWRRRFTPARVLVLSIVTTVVVTWGVAWLVMA